MALYAVERVVSSRQQAKNSNKAGAHQRFLIYCKMTTNSHPTAATPNSSHAHQIQDVFLLFKCILSQQKIQFYSVTYFNTMGLSTLEVGK